MVGSNEAAFQWGKSHTVRYRFDPRLTGWGKARIARQRETDAFIAAKAEYEYLYDKPYEDKKKPRVAGPFTVESLSPHRLLGVDENDELIDGASEKGGTTGGKNRPSRMILEKTAGVQQAHKADKITFTSLVSWPGRYICEGHCLDGETKRRVANHGMPATRQIILTAIHSSRGRSAVDSAVPFVPILPHEM